MQSATFFSSIVFLLGIACFSLCAISLGTTRWRYVISLDAEYGLFQRCDYARPSGFTCDGSATELDQVYIRATRAFMIMGTILVGIGMFLALAAAFQKGKKMHIVMGCFFIISSLFLLVACSVYTGQTRNNPLLYALSDFGYSLWTAWSSTILSFVIIPFAFLSKKSTAKFA